jgi:hypothetical protein
MCTEIRKYAAVSCTEFNKALNVMGGLSLMAKK